jgi:anti-sigma factor RsiW
MNWTCQQTEDRLSEYLDRLLGAEERGALEAHAASCALCGPLVERVAALVSGLHRLPPVEAPARLESRILDATLGLREAKSWRRRLGLFGAIFHPRFAMGMATAALSVFFVLQGLGVSVTEIELADLHPANLYRAADRQAHLMYARSVKFISDLRVVYEIQSRLSPASAPEAEPEAEPRPEGEGQEDRRPQPQNRADELRPIFPVLANTVVPGRSFR